MAAAEKARLATEKEMIADIDETLAVLEMDEVEQNDESSIAEELSEGGGTLDTSNEENTAGSEMKGNEHESDVGMQFENEGSIKGKDVKRSNNGDAKMPEANMNEEDETCLPFCKGGMEGAS
eukprot:2660802-Ditylum_brightwellii.AAC.1